MEEYSMSSMFFHPMVVLLGLLGPGEVHGFGVINNSDGIFYKDRESCLERVAHIMTNVQENVLPVVATQTGVPLELMSMLPKCLKMKTPEDNLKEKEEKENPISNINEGEA